MTITFPSRRAALAVLAAAIAALASPPTASAQLGAAGPYGPQMNYGYFGGTGPYGWGPYSFGWGGSSVIGVGPVMPPFGVPDFRTRILATPTAHPPTAGDLLQQQARAAAWRDRRREALQMEARFDVATGLPRLVPARVAAPLPPLDRRLATLFGLDDAIAWPAGMTGTAPAARRAVEQAARLALDQYRLRGRADVADVADARQALADYSTPIFARLAATDDPLSYETAIDFFQRLDATLIDLADPPADPADQPLEPDPAPEPTADEAPVPPG